MKLQSIHMRYYFMWAVLLLPVFVLGQNNKSLTQTSQTKPEEDSSALFAEFDNVNFFRNNEYRNSFVEGYTLLGFHLNPQLTWHLSEKTKIRGGLHLLKYSGISDFSKTEPVFSIEQSLFDGLTLIMGSIYNNENHHFIDPLYHKEKRLIEPMETGLQFLLNKNFFRGDIWLNWQKFIFHKSPFQEEFEVGAYLSAGIINTEYSKVYLPIQFLAKHQGGQIDNSAKPMQSIMNFAAGPMLDYRLQSSFFRNVQISAKYLDYRDISPNPQLRVSQGNAFYGSFNLKNKFLDLRLSYWYAKDFLPIAGNPLYSVVSAINSTNYRKKELIICEIKYEKNYDPGIFSAGIEFYLNPNTGHVDYSFGISLIVRPGFFITTL